MPSWILAQPGPHLWRAWQEGSPDRPLEAPSRAEILAKIAALEGLSALTERAAIASENARRAGRIGGRARGPAKAASGRLGGLARSERKAVASRENGRKGGRPRKDAKP